MSGKQKIILFGFLLVLCLSCSLFPAKARTFENEFFTFSIPSGWKTMDEIWERTTLPEQEYYGLGLQELVMIQYPPYQGKGKVFFAVATSPLAEGEDLESRFTQAYENTTPEIEDVTQQEFDQYGWSGYEITYKRPWGEPWWRFRDIWLERDGVIYVLSLHTPPDSMDKYEGIFDEILGNFQFKE